VIKEEARFVSAENIILQIQNKNSIETKILEQRLVKIESTFHQKFNSVSSILKQFDSRLKQLISKSKDVDELRLLVEEQILLQEWMNQINGIDEKIRDSEAGANWLDRNRELLIDDVMNSMFSENHLPPNIDVKQEKIDVFCRDLDSYLRWISYFMRAGRKPKDMWSGVVLLSFPSYVYNQAFSMMLKNGLIDSTNLSQKSRQIVRSYISRFLLNRNFVSDRDSID
jgi:hypothetical protein